MTLLEIVVAMALVGIGAAVVAPALGVGGRREPRLHDIVRSARSEALRRAQTLALDITPDGAWRLTIDAPHAADAADAADAAAAGTSTGAAVAAPVNEGRLRAAPSAPLRLRLTPLGTCIAAAPVPAEFEGWDSARCTVDGAGGNGA